MNQPGNIVLCGLMGTGKSTVGQFRQKPLTASSWDGSITGLGVKGYLSALRFILQSNNEAG